MVVIVTFVEINTTPHLAMVKVQEIATQGVPHASKTGAWGTASVGRATPWGAAIAREGVPLWGTVVIGG